MYLADMPPSPQTGSTQHALLGLLSIKPMSGYDMRQLIPESIGHFWRESFGQIYPALRSMEQAELVDKRTEQVPGKPDRNIYSLTDAGRRTLREWVESPPRPQPPRNELLLKLFFGAHAPIPVSAHHVQEFLHTQERECATYAAVAACLERDHAGNPQLPFWLITLSFGRHEAQSGIAWARETLDILERQSASALSPAPHATPEQQQGDTTHA